MLDRRAEDEARVFEGLEFYGGVRFLEHGQLTPVHDLRRCQLSCVDGDPGDGVSLRRLVAPLLALRERDIQVIEGRRRSDLAGGVAVAAEDHARRALRAEALAAEVLR